jgi:hypothetical protein
MAYRLSTFTSHDRIPGTFSANIEDDARVIKNLEARGRELRAQLDRIEERWAMRVEKLGTREYIDGDLRVDYDFTDALA